MWLLQARFHDAIARKDLNAAKQTLDWYLKLSGDSTEPQTIEQRYQFLETLVSRPLAIDAATLKKLAQKILKPFDFESISRESIHRQRTWILSYSRPSDRRMGGIEATATDWRQMHEEMTEAQLPTTPSTLIAFQFPNASLIPAGSPFAFSYGLNAGSNLPKVSYLHSLSYLALLEDRRRLLWIAVAARLQEHETGKLPESIEQLKVTDTDLQVVTNSALGDSFSIVRRDDHSVNREFSYLEISGSGTPFLSYGTVRKLTSLFLEYAAPADPK